MEVDALKRLEQEIKVLIVEELDLEDLAPEEIDSDMSLFGGGLGLSSVNALQLDTALQRRFGGDHAAARGIGDLGTIDLFRYSTVRLLAEALGSAMAPRETRPEDADFGARRRAALERRVDGRNG